MNETIAIFEEISLLITSNSFYNRSIDPSIETSIFHQLETYFSRLTSFNEDFLNSRIDYLSPLILFLLEHLPLEIDLNLLTSTTIDSLPTRKLYKPNLLAFIQHSSESERLLQELYKYLRVNNLDDVLHLKQNSQPIYLHCLHLLKPLLLKTTYDQHPLAIEIFVHIVRSMPQSSLSETLDLIFPVCLMTLDDPSIDMKLLSLYLLDHLQKNSTSTDLLLFNRANVIMYGLEQNLHRRGDRLIFFECLLASTYRWLILLENEVYSGKHLFIRTSQLIERFIRDCLLETNIDYRRSLLQILRVYITRLQLFAMRHLNHFIELIDDSIEHRLLRGDSLQLLLTILQLLKPRIDVHRYELMKIIIRALFQIIHEEKAKTSMIDLLNKCLKELHFSTTENYVPDALKSLIETSQLDFLYREHLQKLSDTLEEQ